MHAGTGKVTGGAFRMVEYGIQFEPGHGTVAVLDATKVKHNTLPAKTVEGEQVRVATALFSKVATITVAKKVLSVGITTINEAVRTNAAAKKAPASASTPAIVGSKRAKRVKMG